MRGYVIVILTMLIGSFVMIQLNIFDSSIAMQALCICVVYPIVLVVLSKLDDVLFGPY